MVDNYADKVDILNLRNLILCDDPAYEEALKKGIDKMAAKLSHGEPVDRRNYLRVDDSYKRRGG